MKQLRLTATTQCWRFSRELTGTLCDKGYLSTLLHLSTRIPTMFPSAKYRVGVHDTTQQHSMKRTSSPEFVHRWTKVVVSMRTVPQSSDSDMWPACRLPACRRLYHNTVNLISTCFECTWLNITTSYIHITSF